MLGNVFSRLQSLTLARPRSVLAVCVLLGLAAAWLGAGVELRTSRSELAPPDDPDQARWDALLADYKASETVIVCVEAAPGETKTVEELERFADLLADRISADVLIERVFHRLDVDWVLLHGLYMLPADTLLEAADAVAGERRWLASLVGAASLTEVNRLLAERLRRPSEAHEPPADAAPAIEYLARLLAAQRELLGNPVAAADRWAGRPLLATLGGERIARLGNGYNKTFDGRTLFLLVTAKSEDDSLAARRSLVARLREHADSVGDSRPGFRVVFTGQPAMSVEEMNTIRSDTWRTSAVAIIGVSLLTLFVFRWKTHSLLVLAALALGVVWALGAVRLELGYLNMITSAFISTLIGVGVAYGIHPVSEYELEGAHTVDAPRTVRESYRRTGPAVAAAGLTTAVAFFSILLMRFRGFAELGLVAGVGVVLCLISAMVFLPALLVVYGRRRHARDRQRRDAPRRLERLWLERMAGRVCRYPRTTTWLAAGLTLGLGWTATDLSFSSNILDLLPRNSESLRYQRRVALESDLSPVFNFVVADDLQQLATMRDRAEREPSIARFESALRFLPTRPVVVRDVLAEWHAWLESLRRAPAPGPLDRESLAASLAELEGLLAGAADDAFTAGLGGIAAALEQARAEAEGCIQVVAAASPETVREWSGAQARLFERRDEALELLRRATATEPPTVDTLPHELRQRFFTGSGKPLGFLFPAGSVFDHAELESYVAASLRVSGTAVGFPTMFHKMSGRITQGFYRAVAVGAVLVFVILLIDLRDLRYALLAAAPLAVGMIWTLGAMRCFGFSFNFANLVAVPLIVGVGIDNGVHVIHRVRLEGRAGMDVVLRHTGRAILISSLTTMIGFGSLALASHRGLESLGVALLLGVGSCLLTSLIVLPNLLVVLRQVPAPSGRRGVS